MGCFLYTYNILTCALYMLDEHNFRARKNNRVTKQYFSERSRVPRDQPSPRILGLVQETNRFKRAINRLNVYNSIGTVCVSRHACQLQCTLKRQYISHTGSF